MNPTEALLTSPSVNLLPCSLLVLKPRAPLKDWVSELCMQRFSGHPNDFTLNEVGQDSVVFCIPQLQSGYEYQKYVEKHYKKLSELTFTSWYAAPESWPALNSYDNFLEFFIPEFHSHVYDIPDESSLSATQPSPIEKTAIQDSPEIIKLNCMVLLLRPMRPFWAWIKNSEHKLPEPLQNIFKKNHAGELLDMNCSAYCIPHWTDETTLESFLLQMSSLFFEQELIKWDIPEEHANKFPASALLTTYFVVETYRTALFFAT